MYGFNILGVAHFSIKCLILEILGGTCPSSPPFTQTLQGMWKLMKCFPFVVISWFIEVS